MKELDTLNNFLQIHFVIGIGQTMQFAHVLFCYLADSTKVMVGTVGRDCRDNYSASYTIEGSGTCYIISAHNLFMRPINKVERILYVK